MIYQTPHIEQINSLFKKRNETLPLKNEYKIRLDKKYRLEFNYNSNHLEGNTLTYGQTELLLYFDKSSGDVPMSDLEEMKAHDESMRIIKEMAADKERPLTEQFIKELNSIILVRPFWKEAITEIGQETRKKIVPGEYISMPNSVRLRNGEIHHYASPEETPAKMNDLMDWYHSEKDKMHPVQLAAEFHYRFVCIHPFDDGNGRVARLVMNYILLFFNYPMVIIKSKDKENYLTALQKADVGERQAIIEYVEKQMLWSLKLELKAANGEDLEEDDDIDKEIELLKREKLRNVIVHKSIEDVNKIITDFNLNSFPFLDVNIKKFEEFFTSKSIDVTSYYLRKNDITVKTQITGDIIDSWPQKANRIISQKVEEFDFNRLTHISWKSSLISLKTVENRFDMSFTFDLNFKESEYDFSVKWFITGKIPRVGENTIYFRKNHYSNLISEIDFKGLKKEISRKILDTINSF